MLVMASGIVRGMAANFADPRGALLKEICVGKLVPDRCNIALVLRPDVPERWEA